MRRTLIAIAVALLVAAPATAAPITFTAVLSGAAESPPVASPGSGFATVVVDPTAHTMQVIASFQDLIGNTTNSHIHCCTALPDTGTAGVATSVPTFPGFPAGVTAGAYNHTFDLLSAASWNPTFVTNNGGTLADAEATLLAGLLAGKAYFNIHSTFAAGGEIRGFLHPVPEPSSMLLMGIGVLAAGATRLRRAR